MSHVQEEPSVPDRTEEAKIILIVDDNAIMREYLKHVLSEATSYHLVLASDGFEALHMVDEMKPSLFLLDDRMPGMNGIELYDRLHEQKALEKTPAIMISVHLPKRELAVRSLIGIQTPFEPSELLTTIAALLGNQEPHQQETL